MHLYNLEHCLLNTVKSAWSRFMPKSEIHRPIVLIVADLCLVFTFSLVWPGILNVTCQTHI